MDPKVIALRKAAALERIEHGLALLVQRFKFDASFAEQLRRSYTDPQLADMLRFEQVAGLLETLVEAVRAAEAARGLSGVPDGRALNERALAKKAKGRRR